MRMRPSAAARCAAARLCLSCAVDAPLEKPFVPEVGQPGKDVAWVATGCMM